MTLKYTEINTLLFILAYNKFTHTKARFCISLMLLSGRSSKRRYKKTRHATRLELGKSTRGLWKRERYSLGVRRSSPPGHGGYHAQSCFLRDLPTPRCLYKHKRSKTIGCFQFYNGESCQSQMVSQLSVRLEIGFIPVAFFFEIFHCWTERRCWEKRCGFIKHGRAAPKHV